MILIRRTEKFCAAHKLWNEQWDAATNAEVFGSCSNPNWHGHNYELIVTVKGNINSTTGFVINLRDLSKIIKERILDIVDHKNFNLDVPFMKGRIPSTENIAVACWEQLEDAILEKGGILDSIEIKETDKNSVIYKGEK